MQMETIFFAGLLLMGAGLVALKIIDWWRDEEEFY